MTDTKATDVKATKESDPTTSASKDVKDVKDVKGATDLKDVKSQEGQGKLSKGPTQEQERLLKQIDADFSSIVYSPTFSLPIVTALFDLKKNSHALFMVQFPSIQHAADSVRLLQKICDPERLKQAAILCESAESIRAHFAQFAKSGTASKTHVGTADITKFLTDASFLPDNIKPVLAAKAGVIYMLEIVFNDSGNSQVLVCGSTVRLGHSLEEICRDIKEISREMDEEWERREEGVGTVQLII